MNSRAALTFLVCFLVMVAYTTLVVPQAQPRSQAAGAVPTPADPLPADPVPATPPAVQPAAPPVAPPVTSAQGGSDPVDPIILAFDAEVAADPEPAPLENAELSVRFQAQGGGIRQLVLKHHRSADRRGEFLLLDSAQVADPLPSLALVVKDAQPPTERARWQVVAQWPDPAAPEKERAVDAAHDGIVRVFRRPLPGGLWLYRRYALAAEGGGLNIDLLAVNPTGVAARLDYRLYGAYGIHTEREQLERGGGARAPRAVINDNGSLSIPDTPVWAADLVEGPRRMSSDQHHRWVALENKYFITLLAPDAATLQRLQQRNRDDRNATGIYFESLIDRRRREEQARDAALSDAELDKQARVNLAVAYYAEGLEVPAGGSLQQRYRFLALPRQQQALAAYADLDAPELLHYTRWAIFRALKRMFGAILHWLHGVTGDFGLAIILLTLMVRAAMHPLSYKGQKNMMAMQKLAPLMKAIQDKYKGKKSPESQRKMQQELMALYRDHGVNPIAGGCLPMLLQMPVFIGLYFTLNDAFELRQAAFGLSWIKDLSLPDALMSFDPPLPLIFGATLEALNILPLIMVATMVVQQKMQPKALDPQQAQQQKMMTYMFVFMGLFFYSMPSGLVLYFITSTLVGLAEQKYIKHRLALT